MDWILQRHYQIDRYSAVALLEGRGGDWLVRVRQYGRDVDMPYEDEGDAHKAFDSAVVGFARLSAAAEKEA
jgi:hypothetical protein